MVIDDLVVAKSNALIEAHYALSLTSQRFLLLAIASTKITDEVMQYVATADFASTYKIAQKTAYKDLIAALDQLGKVRFEIVKAPNTGEKLKRVLKTSIIQAIEYDAEQSQVGFLFSKKALPYLSDLKAQFKLYNLDEIKDFKSLYSIRLFEFLIQYEVLKYRTITVEELRESLALGSKYKQAKDLRMFVVDKAVSDINNFSSYTVSYTQTKKGRTIHAYNFTFTKKSNAKNKKGKQRKEEQLELPLSEPTPTTQSKRKPTKPHKDFVLKIASSNDHFVGKSEQECFKDAVMLKLWNECADWKKYYE